MQKSSSVATSGWLLRALAVGMLGLAVAGGGAAQEPRAPETVAVTVEFEGVEGARRSNVQALSSLARRAAAGGLRVRQIERLHAQAESEIAEALEPFGLYRSTVESELNRDQVPWRAIYRIDPGPQIFVGDVELDIRGDARQDDAFTALEVFFSLEPGSSFTHPEWEAAKGSLQDLGAERGYFDARLTVHQARIDLEAYRVDIELRYESGPRYRYGEVRFEQDFLDPKLLAAYVPFERGAPVDFVQLLQLEAELSGTPYFKGVEVQPLIDERQDGEVPIAVRLVPRRRVGYEAGLGYGTDTGPRVSFALDVRRLNRHGHYAVVEGKLSEVDRRVTASYVLPLVKPKSSRYRIAAGFRQLAPDSSDTQTSFLTASRDRRRGRWGEVVYLSYQRHDFTIASEQDRTRLLIPGVSFTRVGADDRRIPSRGFRVSFELDGAFEGGLSDASFGRIRVGGKLVRSLAERWRVIGRSEVGYLSTDEFLRLPPPVRFFAGGDGSVRGYGYREIGQRDPVTDELIGGETLAVLSAELEWRFLENWGAAVFMDAGSASENFADEWEQGAGFGARWYLPVGLLRADLAWALSRESRPIRLHLGLGFDL